jgi:polyketide cyclase/dehydrase/lipid transport protein
VATFHFAHQRLLDAPADALYHCLTDYTHHHRHQPEGFLPTAFTHLEVLRGGVGAGTIIRFTTRVGGRSMTRTQEVSEPHPGRVLVEWGDGEGSTFSLDRRGERTLLRIETTLEPRGLDALLMPLLGAAILRPIYEEEMRNLEAYARAHTAHAACVA